MEEIVKYAPEVNLVKAKERSKAIRSIKTPKEFIKWRDGKKGQRWKYVKGARVESMLDEHYPGWSFESIETKELFDTIYVKGKLTVLDPDIGIRISSAWGSKEVIKRADTKEVIFEFDYIKSAETDALKRCAKRFGIAADVYSDEDFDFNISEINEKMVPIILDYIKSSNFNEQVLTNIINKMLTNSLTESLITKIKEKMQ